MALSILCVLGTTAQAAATAPNSITHIDDSGTQAFFRYRMTNNTTYADVPASYLVADNRDIVYCTQYTLLVAQGSETDLYRRIKVPGYDAPDAVTPTTKLARVLTEPVITGLNNIMYYGYPCNTVTTPDIQSKYPGITNQQMHYATICAIHAWMYKNNAAGDSDTTQFFKRFAGTPTSRGDETVIQAKGGYEHVYAMFIDLYNYAVNKSSRIPDVSTSNILSLPITLNEAETMYEGTLPVTVNNCSEGVTFTIIPSSATVTQSKIDGNNRIDFKISVPKTSALENMSITLTGRDKAGYADIAFYQLNAAFGVPDDHQAVMLPSLSQTQESEVSRTVTLVATKRRTNDEFYITKYDYDTGEPVAGATITIYDADANIKFTGTTNLLGKCKVTGLYAGQYYFRETRAPQGYVLNPQTYSFQVANNMSVSGTFDFLNEKGITNNAFYITKISSTTNLGLPGAVFEFYDTNGALAFQDTTDGNGRIMVTGLRPGNYTYAETVAPAGYKPVAATYTLVVDSYGAVKASATTIKNEPNSKPAPVPSTTAAPTAWPTYPPYYPYPTVAPTSAVQARFIKVDAKDGTTPLAGAVFTLYDAQNNAIRTVTSAANGFVEFSGLPPGNYTVKETQAPAGYAPSNAAYTFTVTSTTAAAADIYVKNSAAVQTGVQNPYMRILFISAGLGIGLLIYAFVPRKDDVNREDRHETEEKEDGEE